MQRRHIYAPASLIPLAYILSNRSLHLNIRPATCIEKENLKYCEIEKVTYVSDVVSVS